MSSFETTFQSKTCAARCGVLSSRGKQLSTPCVFLDTQCGLPTFLTIQQLSKANLPKHGYAIDLGNIYYLSSTEQINSSFSQKQKKDKNKNKNKTPSKSESERKDYTTASVLNQFYSSGANANSNSNYNTDNTQSIHSFVGMKEHFILLDHQSLIHREPQQGTDKCVVLVTDHGKKRITVEEYMHHVKNINPDLYIIPSEIILSNASRSRCQKNVNRTLKLFNNAVSHHFDLNIDSKCTMIPVVEGACDMEQRDKCCKEMMNKLSIASNQSNINYGFMIGGIGFGESSKQKQEIMESVVKTLNNNHTINGDKFRIINGIRTLDDVLLAVSMGCDVVISSYPTELTQNGVAMIHAIAPEEDEKETDEDDDIDIDHNTNNTNNLYMDHINIRDICYSTDASPILRGCRCYSCSNHSRAYIRHLFNVNEMNAYILLQMHNSYRFLQFVENIKQYLLKDKLSEFSEWWLRYQAKLI